MEKLPSGDMIHRWFIDATVARLDPPDPVILDTRDSLGRALTRFAELDIGCLLLVDDTHTLVGILTERDLVMKLNPEVPLPLETPAVQFATKSPKAVRRSTSLARALNEMSLGGFRHLPVVQSGDIPVGIISAKDLTVFVYTRFKATPENRLKNSPLFELLKESVGSIKSAEVREVQCSTSVATAIKTMRQYRVGALPIFDGEQMLAGIVTERDLLVRGWPAQRALDSIPVSEIMTEGPKTLPVDASIDAAIDLMANGEFRHIPIVDKGGTLSGIVSIKDIFGVLARLIITELGKRQTCG